MVTKGVQLDLFHVWVAPLGNLRHYGPDPAADPSAPAPVEPVEPDGGRADYDDFADAEGYDDYDD
jgi:hypothetical protein